MQKLCFFSTHICIQNLKQAFGLECNLVDGKSLDYRFIIRVHVEKKIFAYRVPIIINSVVFIQFHSFTVQS